MHITEIYTINVTIKQSLKAYKRITINYKYQKYY